MFSRGDGRSGGDGRCLGFLEDVVARRPRPSENSPEFHPSTSATPSFGAALQRYLSKRINCLGCPVLTLIEFQSSGAILFVFPLGHGPISPPWPRSPPLAALGFAHFCFLAFSCRHSCFLSHRGELQFGFFVVLSGQRAEQGRKGRRREGGHGRSGHGSVRKAEKEERKKKVPDGGRKDGAGGVKDRMGNWQLGEGEHSQQQAKTRYQHRAFARLNEGGGWMRFKKKGL